MLELLNLCREKFLGAIAERTGKIDCRVILVTHILPDRRALFSAIEEVAKIDRVIAIPYSIDPPTLRHLQRDYEILTPTLSDLRSAPFLIDVVKSVHGEQPLIIVEIGGYFANAIAQLRELLGPRLVGVIEDTEAGHRKYELQGDSASCPVLSVARSSLKLGEDLLVGTSCIFSCEKLLRSAGLVFEPRRPLVLGFGKVGTGLSHSLQRRGCAPTVFDTDPIRRVVALSSGFRVPKIEAALSQSDIIFGATANKSIRGSMFDGLEHGTILVSCSSKDDEFDLDYMMANYQVSQRFENVDAYSRGNKTLYLMANGRPINFIDGAVLGPALSLVQGEIIAGIKELFDNRGTLGLFELPHDARRKIAEIWFDHFFDPNSGTVRQA